MFVPPRITRLMVRAGWIGAGLVVLGAFYAVRYSRFVPTPLGIDVAVCIAILCAAGGGRIAFKKFPLSGSEKRMGRWIAAPIIALLCAAFGYEAGALGLPAWYTKFLGRYGEQVVIVADWRAASPWRCAGPDIAAAPLISTLCVDQNGAAAKAPPGSMLILYGLASPFGINVEFIDRRE